MPTHPRHLLLLTLAAAPSSCGTDTAPGTNDTSTTGAPRDTSTGAPGTDTGADTQGETQDASSGGLGGTGTGTTQADTSSESSTGTAPVCGDGEVQGDEECDDANAVEGDGCLSDCTREWFVFVTSDPGTQGDFGGVIGADYECRHRATKLFLPNGERYMAWISTSEVQPIDRLYHARGPYKLVNGLRVAANWDALVSGALENPINVTELGHTSETLIFTGTQPDGTRAPGSTHCDDWTDNDGDNFGWYGASTETDYNWTYALKTGCDSGANLICFEQP